MKRVSSRQRLVSWDAFDASVPEEDAAERSEEEDVCFFSASSSACGPHVGSFSTMTPPPKTVLPVPLPSSSSSSSSFVTASSETPLPGSIGTIRNSLNDLVLASLIQSPLAPLPATTVALSAGTTPSTTAAAGLFVPSSEASNSPFSMVSSLKRKRDAKRQSTSSKPVSNVIPLEQNYQPEKEEEKWPLLDHDGNKTTMKEHEYFLNGFSSPTTTTSSSLSSPFVWSLTSLPDEVLLNICSFLAPDNVRPLAQTTHKIWTLLQSDEADLLWKSYLQVQWPQCRATTTRYTCSLVLSPHTHHGSSSNMNSTTHPFHLTDAAESVSSGMSSNSSHSTPKRGLWTASRGFVTTTTTTTTTTPRTVSITNTNTTAPHVSPLATLTKESSMEEDLCGVTSGYKPQELNYNVVLQLAQSTFPSQIDTDLLLPCRWSNSLQRHRRLLQQQQPSSSQAVPLRVVQVMPQGVTAVQYTGTVGTGDRCIRSNQPWKTPLPLQDEKNKKNHKSSSMFQAIPHLVFCGGNHHPSNGGPLSRLFHPTSHNAASSSSPSLRVLNGNTHHHHRHRPSHLLSRLRRTRSSHRRSSTNPMDEPTTTTTATPLFRPFVVPFCTKNNTTGRLEQNVTPRMVHYFEVTILPPASEEQEQERLRAQRLARDRGTDDNQEEEEQFALPQVHLAAETHDSTTATPTTNRNSPRECIAVGLSCNEFSLHSRMPGWDSFSYGYHGDDGGVFYETGHMLRPYGPKFGAGDVVGCGIDYLHHQIFYTLNGHYLGPAWTNLQHADQAFYQQDWYPTVGMDTKCLVHCNFGEQPFCFDLRQYLQDQSSAVEHVLWGCDSKST